MTIRAAGSFGAVPPRTEAAAPGTSLKAGVGLTYTTLEAIAGAPLNSNPDGSCTATSFPLAVGWVGDVPLPGLKSATVATNWPARDPRATAATTYAPAGSEPLAARASFGVPTDAALPSRARRTTDA